MFEIEKRIEDRYIAKYEADSAFEVIELTAKGKYNPNVLIEIAGQPYNVRFWEPEFLSKLDIQPSAKAGLIEIVAKGFFAELTHNPFREEWEELTRDYDGAFVRSGFSTTGQTVIYNRDAVVSAGEVDPREFGLNPRKGRK